MAQSKSLPVSIKKFLTPKAFELWLEKNYAKKSGIWLQFYKKASGKKSITYKEALDVALCFGWIDSQVRAYDADSYIQKFTPRGPRSIWSKINRAHVARLTKEHKMRPSGIAAVAAAKKDGRWGRAYDSAKTMQVPEDFMQELKKNKKAYAFYKTLNRANTYAIAWRLVTAHKTETKKKRAETILNMLAEGKSFH